MLDAVLVCCGGGGLVAGCAVALSRKVPAWPSIPSSPRLRRHRALARGRERVANQRAFDPSVTHCWHRCPASSPSRSTPGFWPAVSRSPTPRSRPRCASRSGTSGSWSSPAVLWRWPRPWPAAPPAGGPSGRRLRRQRGRRPVRPGAGRAQLGIEAAWPVARRSKQRVSTRLHGTHESRSEACVAATHHSAANCAAPHEMFSWGSGKASE